MDHYLHDLIRNLQEFFKTDFLAADDIPENTAQRDGICMEARASLLIEANCTGERFLAFMKCGRRENSCWIFSFPQPFARQLTHSFADGKANLDWNFFEFEVGNEQFVIDSLGHTAERWRLKVASVLKKINLRQHTNWHGNGCTVDQSNAELANDFELIQRDFHWTYRSRFKLCSEVSPYKTPEQVCRFFGNRGEVFAKLKSGNMHPDCFLQAAPAVDRQDGQMQWTEERVLQWNLQQILPCTLAGPQQPQLSNKYYDNWFCQVFPFRNEYGEIRMQLMKLYDPETQTKCLIPVTTWMRGNYPYNQYFCVPLPEDKQPLYNLDLLLDSETETVILTDSVELADSNQRKAPAGIVFTSFICSPGCYEQVDWSPLREKEVWYLVANHSGISLEAAYLKAKDIADFLLAQEDISLKYIQLKVEYPILRHFESVDTLLDCYRNRKPEVKPESLLLLENDTDFEVQYQKAVEFIHSKPAEWWEKENSSGEQSRLIEKEKKSLTAISYVMHPILIRGEVTMLYAKEKTGKSALAYSIAARVAAGNSAASKMVVPEQWWAAKGKHKVLYLDFENKGNISNNQTKFQDAYLPDAANCPDLLMKDMSGSDIDWTLPAHHQKLLDMIDDAQNSGTPGVDVDLLVIDTYSAFVHGETPQTPSNFRDLMNKLRSRNIAILIVHHANHEGEAKGLKEKCQGLALSLKLTRTDVVQEDLEDPVTIEYGDDRYGIPKKLKKPFQIQYSNKDKLWHSVDPSYDENETLKIFYNNYIDRGYGRDNACVMLGLGKTAINDRINKK